MEAVPIAMRRATPAECRKQACKDTRYCLLGLWLAAFPQHIPFVPQWALILFWLAMACGYAKSAAAGFLLTRHFGQTVTYRIGPRKHPFWQRTITYSVPRVPAKPKDPPPPSLIITLAWTLVTGILLLLTANAFIDLPKVSLWRAFLYVMCDTALAVYTIYNWKLIAQQKRHRSLARPRNTDP